MQSIFTDTVKCLGALYPPRESRAVARALLEDAFGITLTDIYSGKVREFSPDERILFVSMLQRLEKGEPVQYVTGTALFDGLRLRVDRSVLIPRPETEELVAWVAADANEGEDIIDACTGSGCIALALKRRLPRSRISAFDISPEALAMARSNARRLSLDVAFFSLDLLSPTALSLQKTDIIVSNPPYVAVSEKEEMDSNVLSWEPGSALFVSDSDPLVFYRALATAGRASLRDGGCIYAEINPRFASVTEQLFRAEGYANILIRRDMEGKERMIRAQKNK